MRFLKIALLVLIVLVLLAGVAWSIPSVRAHIEYFWYGSSILVGGGQSALSATAPSLASSTLPTEPVGPVAVTAISPTNITVQISTSTIPGEGTRTFAISGGTRIWSVAFQGQAGKSLSNIAVGTMVTIYPDKGDPTKATDIAFERDSSLVPSTQDVKNSINGTVTATSNTSVTIAPSNSSPVAIALQPSTKIITTVVAGMPGRAITVGDHAAAFGLTTVGGKTTAKLILLATVIATN